MRHPGSTDRFIARLATSGLASLFLVASARSDPPTGDDLVFHVTDFGINQYWRDWMRTGDPFRQDGNDARHLSYWFHGLEQDHLRREGVAQILIPMPTDVELERSPAELRRAIGDSLHSAVAAAREAGARTFEIQLVQNMDAKRYATAQHLAAKFGQAAYAAIGDVLERRTSAGDDVAVDLTLGSNGTVAFTASLESWKRYAEAIRFVDLVDGRASFESTSRAIEVLSASRVRISNTRRDLPAPVPLLSAAYALNPARMFIHSRTGWVPPVADSIADHSTALRIAREHPGVAVDLLTPKSKKPMKALGDFFRHIEVMTAPANAFAIERTIYSGKRPTKVALELTGAARRDEWTRSSGAADVPVRAYYTDEAPWKPSGQTMTEARVIVGLVSDARRIAVFGDSEHAEITLREAQRRVGPENVLFVRRMPSQQEQQSIARSFGADAICGVRRPVQGAVHADGIGGVMLRGSARVDGDRPPITPSGFDLLLHGESGALDVTSYRRFVTALWAVYFGAEGPGISIDPIAPGCDRHVVRYIGNVVDLDIARVMREADYLMKRWSVSADRPLLSNYESPDDIAGRLGRVRVGVASRFWFVPQELRFVSSGGVLRFEGGHMALRTEYLGETATGTDPANEEWARWFTLRYAEIAAAHPVFDELFEYAKMVTLARYLLESEVPMVSFLLANRSLVLGEDSVGTVTAFERDSRHFPGVRIEGGVDLGRSAPAGRIVVDEAVSQALADAFAQGRVVAWSPSATVTESGRAPELVCSRAAPLAGEGDILGLDVQADVAVFADGMPALELARAHRPDELRTISFGKGWSLILPYEVRTSLAERASFGNANVPARIDVVDLLSGDAQPLTFEIDAEGRGRYVPAGEEPGEISEAFLLSDSGFVACDRLGAQYRFDPDGRLVRMTLGDVYDVAMERGIVELEAGCWNEPLPRLVPHGRERAVVGPSSLPRRLRLVGEDGRFEAVFHLEEGAAGDIRYRSEADDPRHVAVVPLTDGTFRLICASDVEIEFGVDGAPVALRAEAIRRIEHGSLEARFEYEGGRDGLRVRELRVADADGARELARARYRYDERGLLVGVDRYPLPDVELDYLDGRVVARGPTASTAGRDPDRTLVR